MGKYFVDIEPLARDVVTVFVISAMGHYDDK